MDKHAKLLEKIIQIQVLAGGGVRIKNNPEAWQTILVAIEDICEDILKGEELNDKKMAE